MKRNIAKGLPWLALTAVLTLIDGLSKLWAERVLMTAGSMPLIDGVIGLTYARNTGAAFSAFSGATALLSIVSLSICICVGVYLLKHPEAGRLLKLSLSMVLAGGLGNLIDRVTRGYVVDYFELKFMKFAIFNAADVFITAGAALLFIAMLLGGERNGRMDG